MAEQETRTQAEWEKEQGIMFLDYSPNKKVTRDELNELQLKREIVSIDYEGRTKFLKDNGYELTRENYLDGTLTVRQDSEDDGDKPE